jgi:hypothetical protein
VCLSASAARLALLVCVALLKTSMP